MQKKNKIVSLLTVVFFLFPLLCIHSQEIKVKNVVFMIGDGMGLSHIYAAMTKNNGKLNIERCTYSGFSKTYSANNYTTDSGAGGTALACGVKTNNGMIGLSADSLPQKSILEVAHQQGLSTGVVVACNVTHATPASYLAHRVHRSMTSAIAQDIVNSGVDVLIGGGKKDFESIHNGSSLTRQCVEKGYQMLYTINDVLAVDTGKIVALLADNHPPKAAERQDLLYNGTKKALELLSKNDKGFFLLVEASQIDWASHKNNFNDVIDEVLDFDKVIGLVLDFAAAQGGNTLVIITADHETGGLVLLNKDSETGKIKKKFTTKHHSATPVPVFSFGVGAENFSGFMENTSFFDKLMKLYQFKDY
ncbi:MAG: alkaline phosphatase [Paludibacteraceae bacterium]|nr:alkaline phosphatase [Paludibacteraceae bacterium]